MSSKFPFFRITLLGSSGCGKTALANVFINSFFPLYHIETDFITVYHKAIRLGGEEEESQTQQILIEVEDTYGSNRGEDGRNVKRLLDMDRAEPGEDDGKRRGGGEKLSAIPFARIPPPHTAKDCMDCPCLSRGRMGFLIIFDCGDPDSWTEAMTVHAMMLEESAKRQDRLKPMCVIVANKTDRENEGPHVKNTIENAELYCNKMMVRLVKCSAKLNKNVKRAFKDLALLVQGNQLLWLVEDDDDEEEDEVERSAVLEVVEEVKGKCSLM